MLSRLRLRFGLATSASAAEVTLDHLAPEDTKRVRPDTIRPSGAVEAHFAFRGHYRGRNSRRQNSLRRDGSLGGHYPTNV